MNDSLFIFKRNHRINFCILVLSVAKHCSENIRALFARAVDLIKVARFRFRCNEYYLPFLIHISIGYPIQSVSEKQISSHDLLLEAHEKEEE